MPNVISYVKHNYLLKHDDSWTSSDSIEDSLTHSTVESAKTPHILSEHFEWKRCQIYLFELINKPDTIFIGLFFASRPSWSMSGNTSANTLPYRVTKSLGAGWLISLQRSTNRCKLTFVRVHSNKCPIRFGSLSISLTQCPVGGAWIQ